MWSVTLSSHPLVLSIDDDPTVNLLVHAVLEQAGFRVEHAENGRLGLEAFDRVHPDVVLMDVMMPEMDGFAASAELRRRPGGAQIPILMMTGLDDHESIMQAFDAGATDFITKPINYPLLSHRVRYLLRASAALNRLQESERRLAIAQRIARLGHWEWFPEQGLFRFSEEVSRIIGLGPPQGDVPFQTFCERVLEKDRTRVRAWFTEVRNSGYSEGLNHWVLGLESEPRYVRQQVEAVFDQSQQVVRLHGTLQDITELQRAEERIRHLAFIDSLTELPNRALFKDRLNEAIKLAKRHARQVGLLFLDLDNFKQINDTLGHGMGDLLLQSTAERLRHSLRCSDTISHMPAYETEQTIARFGGDEFIVLLPEIRRSDDAAVVAEHIQANFVQPFLLAGHEVFVTPSIGIAVFPDDGDDPDMLLRNADMAMYLAKRQGRNLYRFYDAALNEMALKRLTMENHLRKAIEQGDLSLHYQPQLDLSTGRITGVEALLRWHNAALGSISPADFIPLAEETGLIIPIGEWVLHTACQQAKHWRDQGLGLSRMAVNISVLQFVQPGFPGLVARILAETRLEPEALELEITESFLMKDPEKATAILHTLKALGVQLAIDDFGTGYSSLGRLRQLPLDRLKIDRTFVRDINTRPDDTAIATAIIAMADSMGLCVVAEGVETEAQIHFLKAKHCDEVQGYYLSRPQPVEHMGEFLRNYQQGGLDKVALTIEGRRLLIVAGTAMAAAMEAALAPEGYQLFIADEARAALDLLASHDIGVLVADWRLKQGDQPLFQRARELYPRTLRIATGEGCAIEGLIELINEGALYQFVPGPLAPKLFRGVVRKAFLSYERARKVA